MVRHLIAGPTARIPQVRVAVYTDYAYHRVGGSIYAERAFAIFLSRLAHQTERLIVVGRLSTGASENARYALGAGVELVALPYYEHLTEPGPVLRSLAGSLTRFWKALDDVDAVWLFGPHPFAFAFALMAALRGRRIILGVRQDTPAYVRNRHPGKRLVHLAADTLDAGFKALARLWPIVTVGPALARHFRKSRAVLEIAVSLVDEEEMLPASALEDRSYDGPLTVLSVGRLETEKNPLLLADVLAALREDGRDWRLVICGEGSLRGELEQRLAELGVAEHAVLRGYVAHESLTRLYRESDLLLHVSWTEGLPQILFEAFAAALPAVATDVGGIREAAGDGLELIPAGDAAAAATALRRLADEPERRRELVAAGHELVAARTLQAETRRVAELLAVA